MPYAIGKPISNDIEEPPAIEQTGMTNQVPPSYLSAAAQGGAVREIKYQSKDYAGNGGDITKQAFVYLPYGYDEKDADTRYNILYLMHGWGGHAGEYFEYANIKNIFDNMIANGDIEPLIVVSATFYHDNSDRDFGSSEDALRAFHNDFENHLMQAVEGQFHTYAKSTSAEDLKASRDHRAFGGFSLGSVTTWLQFCYDYDYIRYFLPMSGSSWYYGTYGTEAFGEKSYPKPAAVIMQYTGLSEVTGNEPPTYNCVGTSDGIANYRTMQSRINGIKANGTDADIEIFDRLPHGFGLGTGTVAEGWIDNAVAFWERKI